MALLFIIFVYNAVSIPLRASFGLDTSNSTDPSLIVVWLVCDHFADLVYIMDLILIQSHLSSLRSGLLAVSDGY